MSASGIVKISDFGFACFLDGKTEIVAELPTDSKPLRWMAPEAFEDNLFNEASDVYVVVMMNSVHFHCIQYFILVVFHIDGHLVSPCGSSSVKVW